jgi:hypothetical protein
MIQMICVGNGITNARIALLSTIPNDSKLSLKEMNFPASAFGALDKTYALTPGQKNNRPKLLANNVRIKTMVVNLKSKQIPATIKTAVVILSILRYPYLSRIYPAGISHTSWTIDADPIAIPTIRSGNTCSHKGESNVKCKPAPNLNIVKNNRNGRYCLNKLYIFPRNVSIIEWFAIR